MFSLRIYCVSDGFSCMLWWPVTEIVLPVEGGGTGFWLESKTIHLCMLSALGNLGSGGGKGKESLWSGITINHRMAINDLLAGT